MCALLQKTFTSKKNLAITLQGNVLCTYITYNQFIRGKNGEYKKKEDDKNKLNTLEVSRAFVRPTIS